MRCTCANRILSFVPACTLGSRACYRNRLPILHHASLPQNWSVQTPIPGQPLWAPRWWFCVAHSSFSFTPRKSSFLSDDCLISKMYSVRRFLLITMPSGLRFQSDLHKSLSGTNHGVAFRTLSQRQSFCNFCCPFRQLFSAAYLLKLFLLPQRVYTTLFVKWRLLLLLLVKK